MKKNNKQLAKSVNKAPQVLAKNVTFSTYDRNKTFEEAYDEERLELLICAILDRRYD